MPIDQRGAPIPGWSSSDVQREVSHRLKRDGNPLQYLPSASTYAIYAPDGGLLSLGSDMGSIFQRAAEYVYRILHGARPSELPVERPAKFRLSVNLTTAKALGLTVLPSILARADEVIE